LFESYVAAQLKQSAGSVVTDRTPILRAGKAYWVEKKAYREYESCCFPLSANGQTVNVILGAMKFPETTTPQP